MFLYIGIVIVLILLFYYYYYDWREEKFYQTGIKIARIKAKLQQQENALNSRKCHNHAQDIIKCAYLSEIDSAKKKLHNVEEDLKMCKATLSTPTDVVRMPAFDGITEPVHQVISPNVDNDIASVDSMPKESLTGGYIRNPSFIVHPQNALCVGSICTEKVSKHNINPLLMRIDHQENQINQLQYELINRDARISDLLNRINYATGMY